MASSKTKVVSPPKSTSRRRRNPPSDRLRSLALSQLDDALQEGQASVSELLKILSLPVPESNAAPLLPDGWVITPEEATPGQSG